ncbi:amidohydrolase family protein [Paramicrobacterium fandaimingii]|uniref:amidohydrolase family protein n=1 Tax=Paramicrobacterium fandaimingii TaxID=2708079 RepID=UPI00142174F9|nr:amidohydrolase family protein [Microbacterium fandaimingii]
MSQVIDAHHHYWRTAAQEQPWRTDAHHVLKQDFGPDDLVTELDAAGVDATVLIQSVDERAENNRLADYARFERTAGIVSWLPVSQGTQAIAELERLHIPKQRGVRCLIARDPLSWLQNADVIRLFNELASRGLAWDVVPVTPEQTAAVTMLARAVPELRIVVDHLGRPPVESGEGEVWAANIGQLAACDNVAMKVSVGIDILSAWPRWDAQMLRPFVDHVVSKFGVDRLMLASNWPVVLHRQSYGNAWRDLRELVEAHNLSQSERDALSGGTAQRWYALGTSVEDREVRRADSGMR